MYGGPKISDYAALTQWTSLRRGHGGQHHCQRHHFGRGVGGGSGVLCPSFDVAIQAVKRFRERLRSPQKAVAWAMSSAPFSVAPIDALTVPAVRMGRLAVDQALKRRGLDSALLADAPDRTAGAEIAVCACVVVAKDAVAFYPHHSFIDLPESPLTRFFPLLIRPVDSSITRSG